MVRPKFKSNGAIFLVLNVCLIMCFQMADAATIQAPNSNVCNTEACKNIAFSILQKMNQSVDPCVNFYDFVCGNFTKNSVIAPTSSSNNLDILLDDLVHEKLRDDIENHITNKDPEAFQKMLSYYKICMDENQIERTGNNEFVEILNELGGWPVLVGKSYDDSKFDWKDVIKKINKMGYSGNYFFKVVVASDWKNSTINRLYIRIPEFRVSGVHLTEGLKNSVVKDYYKFMVDVAEIFGANRNQAEVELKDALNFELELFKITSSDSKLSDEGDKHMKISELQRKYPIIPWLEYINSWLSPTQVVTEDEVVIVNARARPFLTNLGKLLSRTPNRVLANYALARVAIESAPKLSEKVRGANNFPRWFSCIFSVADDLYLATSSLYVRRHVDKSSKSGILDMTERIRQSFKTIISEADWMDETTRNTALNKLEKILALAAYPDEVLDDKKIDDYYKDLKLVPGSFLKTFLSYKRFQRQQNLVGFRKSIPRLDWTKYASASHLVNAFYSSSTNVIRILAGVMQGDFYNKDFPKYVNFGAIGEFIGHELTHGFDNEGRVFDATGNFNNWWSADTEKKYLEKAQCLIDQYSKYTVSPVNLKVRGDQTVDENIADNGGIKESYMAYETYEKENGVEPILPGFESFTSRQLFWISNANVWCAKYRDEWLKEVIFTDSHSPNPIRVIGSMSNSPYFAKDFNCPTGSPMNPINKCSVW